MNIFMSHVLEASKMTLTNNKLLIVFLVLWALLFATMFSIPLNVIPGNDIKFQAAIFNGRDYALLGVLSLLSSLVITMQINIFRNKLMTSRGVGNTTVGGLGVFSGIFSSIFASATCAMCLGSLFGFLGFGTVLFLVENRWSILAGAIILLFISLYLASRRLIEGCRSCVAIEVG